MPDLTPSAGEPVDEPRSLSHAARYFRTPYRIRSAEIPNDFPSIDNGENTSVDSWIEKKLDGIPARPDASRGDAFTEPERLQADSQP